MTASTKRRDTMKHEERLNALEVALNNEMQERKFYLKHAERTKNPHGKAMFEQIAEEELEHHDMLKKLHERWIKQEKWPETLPLTVKKTRVQDVLKEHVQKVEELPEQDEDDLKAVQAALDFEAKGEAHYAKLRDAVSDPKEKAFFDLLSNMERQHYLSLKDTEEFLADPASWYARTERHTLDGG
jgi:rubrerythrin